MDKKITYILYQYTNRQARVKMKAKAYSLVRKLLIGFILASIVNFVFSYFFHTPKVYEMTRINNELMTKYVLLQEKMDRTIGLMHEIKDRDQGIYRMLFGIDTLTPNKKVVSEAVYQEAQGNRHFQQIKESWRRLDSITNMVYQQSYSLDTLQLLAYDKERMADAMPSICPVDPKMITNSIGKFGGRIHPIYRVYKMHYGIDIPGKKGTPIYAAADGVVLTSRHEKGYGFSVLVNHSYGYKTRYAHLSKLIAKPGQTVKRGELIGEMGSTGTSSGNHLHYEVIYRNTCMNPINYFSRDMKKEDYEKIVNSAKETIYEE